MIKFIKKILIRVFIGVFLTGTVFFVLSLFANIIEGQALTEILTYVLAVLLIMLFSIPLYLIGDIIMTIIKKYKEKNNKRAIK